MVPYLEVPTLYLGPVAAPPFGIMAVLSVVSGLWYSYRVAEHQFRGGGVLLDMAPWFLFLGFFTGHVVSLVFYYPSLLDDTKVRDIVSITSGLSSFGGLFGGALGAYLFIRRHGLALLPWLDILMRAFALSYIFGRFGCAIVHDHPGLPTTFFLAMDYPARDGFPAGPRHDLGFYEFLFWLTAFPVVHWLGQKRRPDGFILGLMIVWYTPIRFGLDFLRTNDMTYTGLTFAQWSCVAVFPLGVWLLWRARNHPAYAVAIPQYP